MSCCAHIPSLSLLRLPAAPHLLATVCAAAALVLGSMAAQAQMQTPAQQPGASRIDRVTLYQGSATVERTLALAAGARAAVFTCLPAALDPQSLQAQGDGVRVGEVRVDTSERALVPECASAQEGGIRSVEDELARVNAAVSALQLSDSYLKTVATLAPSSEGGKGLAAPNPAQIQATAEALRRSLEDNQLRAHQLQREKGVLEQRLRALQQEQGRSAGAQSQVMRVRVQLATERAAALRLVYQVRGPAWQSSYRATLEGMDGTGGTSGLDNRGGRQGQGSSTGSVRIERLATVAQNTGEDWSGVQLRLSTGAPQRAAQGRLPRPWVLDIAPPPALQMARSKAMAEASDMAMAAPAPAPAAGAAAQEPALPDFEVQVEEGAYATEFAVPGRTSVPGSGERTTLALGSTDAPARLLTRTTPAVELAAYLVAHIARPAGVWPAGPVALLQGTRFIGNGRLDFSSTSSHAGSAAADAVSTELAFGRDDKVAVRAEPVQDTRGTAGLTGASTERTVQSNYRIDNQHASAIELQVLHAAPVSRDEKIEVRSRYTPEPASLGFGGAPGTVLWQQSLPAGASARFAAEHVLRYPKDVQLREQR